MPLNILRIKLVSYFTILTFVLCIYNLSPSLPSSRLKNKKLQLRWLMQQRHLLFLFLPKYGDALSSCYFSRFI